MRFARRLVALSALAVLTAACDSSQPAQVEISTASINITATNALSRMLDVWNVIEDTNNDGQPDDGVTYLWCQGPVQQTQIPITVPWPYSVEVSVIRAGSNERTVVTSAAATAVNFNVAQYDRTSQIVGVTPSKPPQTVNGRIFKFSSPRRLPAVRFELMNAVRSPLATLLGATYGNGVCSPGTPGTARLDNIPLPASFELNKGDTVIVKARMGTAPTSGSGLTTALVQNPTGIAGQLMVDGRSVSPQGTTSGSALSFSFTIR